MSPSDEFRGTCPPDNHTADQPIPEQARRFGLSLGGLELVLRQCLVACLIPLLAKAGITPNPFIIFHMYTVYAYIEIF